MSSHLPPGWSAHQDTNGTWYYAHASGLTQWHFPQQAPPSQGPSPAGYPAQQQGHQYQQHNQHYQYQSQNYQGQASSSSSHKQSQQRNQSQGAALTPSSSNYIYSKPVEFQLKEKAISLSGDAFKVKRLDTKETVFRVRGNLLSFRDSKTLNDANDVPIYKMAESVLTLHGRMQIQDSRTGQALITLRKKSFIPMMGTSTIQGWRGTKEEGNPDYVVKGDWFRKDFTVKDKTGNVLAVVRRKSLSFSNLVLEKDTYVIRVEPGVDAALIIFFIVAVDEHYRDDGNRRGHGTLLDVF